MSAAVGGLGIALGGGGARGFAHIGALAALAAERDPALAPTCVAGTSIGAVVGALVAAGRTAEDLERIGLDIGWFSDVIDSAATLRAVLGDLAERLPWKPSRGKGDRAGLLSNANLGAWIEEHTRTSTFSGLALPYACVAADLERGERVILTAPHVAERLGAVEAVTPSVPTVVVPTEDLGLAVRASAAIPGAFEQVAVAGRRLVDGGVVEQVPVLTCRALGARVVLAIGLGTVQTHATIELPHHAAACSLALALRPGVDRALAAADVVVVPEGIDLASVTDLSSRAVLFARGFAAMKTRIPALRAALAGTNYPA